MGPFLLGWETWMPAIDKNTQPDLFRFVTDSNLLRQYDLVKTMVEIGIKTLNFRVDHNTIQQLNAYAVLFLCDTAGSYRTGSVGIRGSQHQPPAGPTVPGHMADLLKYLDTNWTAKDGIHLAAYALWRLCWIHPFVEGNGRAARATSYLILCVKNGMWLPGSNTIPKQIRDNRPAYIAALAAADGPWKNGILDVSAVETLLTQLLTIQLS